MVGSESNRMQKNTIREVSSFQPMKDSFEKIILDLGCGPYYLPYFKTKIIRLDIRKEVNPDIIRDVRKGLPLKSKSVDMVYCSHFLEHFKKTEILKILQEIHRVLKMQGLFYVTVPNVAWAAMQISRGIYDDYVNKVLYGAQDYKFNMHQTGFTPEILEKMLLKSGFFKLSTTTQFYNINTIAKKRSLKMKYCNL